MELSGAPYQCLEKVWYYLELNWWYYLELHGIVWRKYGVSRVTLAILSGDSIQFQMKSVIFPITNRAKPDKSGDV